MTQVSSLQMSVLDNIDLVLLLIFATTGYSQCPHFRSREAIAWRCIGSYRILPFSRYGDKILARYVVQLFMIAK